MTCVTDKGVVIIDNAQCEVTHICKRLRTWMDEVVERRYMSEHDVGWS
jgi:hypothetical protein